MLLLPAIDLRDGKCVRLRQGDYNQETIFGNQPGEMAKRWADEGAEMLHLVDLDGAKAGKPVNLEAIKAITSSIKIPCQLGGGIRDEASIRLLLEEMGIARVIVGTKALREPDWFESMTTMFPHKIVLGVDAKDGMVATEGWLETSKTSAYDLAKRYANLPVAAIVYTNIANDGMMQGIDQGTLNDLAKLSDLGISTVASGGVTTLQDIKNLQQMHQTHPHLDSIIIGRAIYEGTIQLPEALALVKG
ncbi:1-(5-phosphoribosyl)-5-[(5-phosphoribosylamino)methylideneamino]imidazole-4-carboxamide isomerase [Lacunimicrobium album]